MIICKIGNIFSENVEALVNPVNCIGVMGKGLAALFKKRYPSNFKSYATACSLGYVVPGKVHSYAVRGLIGPRYIINFPTKRHWRDSSNLEDIANGLYDLHSFAVEHNIKSIAIPALGCGEGGLAWHAVKPLIVSTFETLPDVETIIFEPNQLSTPIEHVNVCNKHHGYSGIYIGRGSPLGNKYRIGTDGDRPTVIAKYRDWITQQIKLREPVVMTELNRIYDLACESSVNLICFCAPQACHGDVIKELILRRMKRRNIINNSEK